MKDKFTLLEEAAERAEDLPTLRCLAETIRWHMDNGFTDDDIRRWAWRLDDVIDELNAIVQLLEEVLGDA